MYTFILVIYFKEINHDEQCVTVYGQKGDVYDFMLLFEIFDLLPIKA